MLDIEKQRSEFPGLTDKLYFNFGGQGILPRAGWEAIVQAHQYLEEQGPFSGRINEWLNERTEQLRQDMARCLGVEPRTLSITEDVTVGCNIPANTPALSPPYRRSPDVLGLSFPFVRFSKPSTEVIRLR
jgi:selenocysteine lyase/cysteine desulfurase